MFSLVLLVVAATPVYGHQECSTSGGTTFIRGTFELSGVAGSGTTTTVTRVKPCFSGADPFQDGTVVLQGFQVERANAKPKMLHSLGVEIAVNSVTLLTGGRIDINWTTTATFRDIPTASDEFAIRVHFEVIATTNIYSRLFRRSVNCSGSDGCDATIHTSVFSVAPFSDFQGFAVEAFRVTRTADHFHVLSVDVSEGGVIPTGEVLWKPLCAAPGAGTPIPVDCSMTASFLMSMPGEMRRDQVELIESRNDSFDVPKNVSFPVPPNVPELCSMSSFSFSSWWESKPWGVWAGTLEQDCGYSPSGFTARFIGANATVDPGVYSPFATGVPTYDFFETRAKVRNSWFY